MANNPIVDFLRTGMIGTVRIGSSIDAAVEELGVPDDFSNKSRSGRAILRFGSLQLASDSARRVTMLLLSFAHVPAKFPLGRLRGCTVYTSRPQLREVLRACAEGRVIVSRVPELTFDDQSAFVTEANVVIVACTESGEIEKLICTEASAQTPGIEPGRSYW